MKETLALVTGFFHARPILSGAFGTIAGWSGAVISWLDSAHKLVTFFGAIFGTTAALFTMLIVIRNWYKGRDK